MATYQSSKASYIAKKCERTSVIWEHHVPRITCYIYEALVSYSAKHGYTFGSAPRWIAEKAELCPFDFVQRMHWLYQEGWLKVSQTEYQGRKCTVYIPNESPLFEDNENYPDMPELVFHGYGLEPGGEESEAQED